MKKGTALRTVLLGFGKIGAGYAADSRMANYFKYSTHAQVLKDHPQFSLEAVVDSDPEVCLSAVHDWKVKQAVVSIDQLKNRGEIDVLVMATPPTKRLGIAEKFSNLKAVLIEKPLANSFVEAEKLGEVLRQRRIIAQVNFLRRADIQTRNFANGCLFDEIGKPQFATGVYGNGLINNGTHMIDLVRMLLGEIVSVQSLGAENQFEEGPIKGDRNFSFLLKLKNGLLVSMHPLHFSHYRENGLEVWGEKGKLEYMHGGLTLLKSPLLPNRMMENTSEIACDHSVKIASTLGTAIYEIYTNLADAIHEAKPLLSPFESGLKTVKVVEALFLSAAQSNKEICLESCEQNV